MKIYKYPRFSARQNKAIKIPPQKRRGIKILHFCGYSQPTLAKIFGVTKENIYYIIHPEKVKKTKYSKEYYQKNKEKINKSIYKYKRKKWRTQGGKLYRYTKSRKIIKEKKKAILNILRG